MKVTIIGQGFVGLSLSVVLASKKIQVNAIDINKEKILNLKKAKPPFYEPNLDISLKKCIKLKTIEFYYSHDQVKALGEIIFIAVPTPNINGKINLDFVSSVLNNILPSLKNMNTKPVVVIKSTIAPGTTDRTLLPIFKKFFKKLGSDFYLAINPEFLREGNAINDQLKPHVIVLGTMDKSTKLKLNNFFRKLYGNKIPIINTNFATAELIKYSNNAFLATKISFINSISNLCQNIPGANIDEVAKVIGMDSRIGPLFLNAGPGFGGSCLPKDLESFISVFKTYKIQSELLESVKKINDKQIDIIIKITKENLKKLTGKTISILGLAFKENSDDIRESKSIELIKKLLFYDCKIQVYDPLAIENTKNVFSDKIFYADSILECINNSDCVIIMNSNNEFKNMKKQELKKLVKIFVIDTRRILKNSLSKKNYIQIGVKN